MRQTRPWPSLCVVCLWVSWALLWSAANADGLADHAAALVSDGLSGLEPGRATGSSQPLHDLASWILVLIVAAAGLVAWQAGRRRLQGIDRTLQQTTAQLDEANQKLRKTEARLAQAEEMTALGVLAGGIAHELHDPLQTVLTGAYRIQKFPDDVARHCESARLMERAALHCSTIVQSLLSYTRRSASAREAVDLNEVVDRSLAQLRHVLEQDGIGVHVERGPIPRVEASASELCTAVTNLVMHARDALLSPAAGGRRPTVRIATARTADGVGLVVSDNGPGMPVDIGRTFDPLSATRQIGATTGLRLTVVREIVERHGGSLRVDSREGEGTRFDIHLPVDVHGASDVGDSGPGGDGCT